MVEISQRLGCAVARTMHALSTANNNRKQDGPPGGSPDGGRDSSDHGSNGVSHRDAAADSTSASTCVPNPSNLVLRLSSRHGVDEGSNGGCRLRLGLRI